MLVAAKDLRPGDSVVLPASTSGEALERKAHVCEVRRAVVRTVAGGRIEESDTTTLFYLLDADGSPQAAEAFLSTHNFQLTY
ncbi:MAG TPA: hypothetical protein VG734_25615 [Lacunisphaera sp.]|nr:hypothetical protein [Lacunisphaera sp.]